MVDDLFWDFAKEIKKYQLNIGSEIDVCSAGNSLLLALDNLKTSDIMLFNIFIDTNYDELLKIKFALIEPRKPRSFRSLHDRLFVNCLQFGKQSVLGITRVFEKFIKGITYFEFENVGPTDRRPVYHRLSSCGPGTTGFREKFNQCKPGNKKRLVKKQIETCYIERLIYDEMYKHQTLFLPKTMVSSPSQDHGHRQWLIQTSHDFNTCFPNVSIEVSIDSYEQQWPTSVVIIRNKKGVITKEEYVHDIALGPTGLKQYNRLVSCKLVSGNGQVIKAKVQEFSKRSRWVAIAK